MHRYRAPIFLFAFAAIIFLPHFALAAGGFFGPIIPAGSGDSDLQTCAAGWNGLVTVLNNLIKFALSLAIVIAVIMSAYAGFLWVMNPINPENRSAARTILINSAIGLVLALSAWLIVNTVLIALTGGNITNGSGGSGISNFTGFLSGGDPCIKAQPQGTVAGTQPTTPGGLTTEPATTTPPATTASGNEADVRARFAAAGVSINHDACPTGSSGQGCTNVGGLQESTVQLIIALNSVCGGSCGLTITGGSEPGHASGTYSHGNGYKVDLRLGTAVDSIIAQQQYYVGERTGDSGGPGYKDKCSSSNQYVKESDHWDITVHTACSAPF